MTESEKDINLNEALLKGVAETWEDYLCATIRQQDKALSCRQIYRLTGNLTKNALRVYLYKCVKKGTLVKIKYPGHVSYYALPQWVNKGELKLDKKPF